MSATPNPPKRDADRDRLTLRLPRRELELLKERAQSRQMDVAALAREVIIQYLETTDPRTEQQQLVNSVLEAVRTQADRVINRHEQTTRALITAMNEHWSGK